MTFEAGIAKLREEFNAKVTEALAASRQSFVDAGEDPDVFPISAMLEEGRAHTLAVAEHEWERIERELRASNVITASA